MWVRLINVYLRIFLYSEEYLLCRKISVKEV